MAVFKNIQTLSTNSTIGAYTQVVNIGAAGITLTLPSVTNNSFIGYAHKILIVDSSSNLGYSSGTVGIVTIQPNGSDTGFTINGETSVEISGKGLGFELEYVGDNRWILSTLRGDSWIINPGDYRILTSIEQATGPQEQYAYANEDFIISTQNTEGDPEGQFIQGLPNNVYNSSSSPTETGTTREGRFRMSINSVSESEAYYMPMVMGDIPAGGAATSRYLWIDWDADFTIATLDIRLAIVDTSTAGTAPYNVRHMKILAMAKANDTSFAIVGDPYYIIPRSGLPGLQVILGNDTDNRAQIRFTNSYSNSVKAIGSIRMVTTLNQ